MHAVLDACALIRAFNSDQCPYAYGENTAKAQIWLGV